MRPACRVAIPGAGRFPHQCQMVISVLGTQPQELSPATCVSHPLRDDNTLASTAELGSVLPADPRHTQPGSPARIRAVLSHCAVCVCSLPWPAGIEEVLCSQLWPQAP